MLLGVWDMADEVEDGVRDLEPRFMIPVLRCQISLQDHPNALEKGPNAPLDRPEAAAR